ncbi:MAG: nucleotide sugar dehydrogenase [Candidatus Hodarchaeales archaeon]
MKKIGIIGLGYVGLPLLCLVSEKGYEVIGFDIDKNKLEAIENKTLTLEDDIVKKFFERGTNKLQVTNDPVDLTQSDISIICVPTPVFNDFTPDLAPLKSATEIVAKTLRKGQLVVVESTIYPGTIEEIVKPILEEQTGLIAGQDFYLAHCPERIDPGNKKWTLRNIPRVCGAMSKRGLDLTVEFYSSILDGEVHPLSSLKAAEACKVVENSFRDINIAFVNELAISFDIMDIDVMEVINGAATKPFAFMPHYPGAGVGGHCIPVDPYYLIKKAHDLGFEHKFLRLAREINNQMPLYTVNLLKKMAEELDIDLKSKTVGLMGIAFKKNINDIRNSPFHHIQRTLKEESIPTVCFDPYVPELSSVDSIEELLEKSQFLILVTDHKEFSKIKPAQFKDKNIIGIVDGRNILDKKQIKKLGIQYKGIGRN